MELSCFGGFQNCLAKIFFTSLIQTGWAKTFEWEELISTLPRLLILLQMSLDEATPTHPKCTRYAITRVVAGLIMARAVKKGSRVKIKINIVTNAFSSSNSKSIMSYKMYMNVYCAEFTRLFLQWPICTGRRLQYMYSVSLIRMYMTCTEHWGTWRDHLTWWPSTTDDNALVVTACRSTWQYY